MYDALYLLNKKLKRIEQICSFTLFEPNYVVYQLNESLKAYDFHCTIITKGSWSWTDPNNSFNLCLRNQKYSHSSSFWSNLSLRDVNRLCHVHYKIILRQNQVNLKMKHRKKKEKNEREYYVNINFAHDVILSCKLSKNESLYPISTNLFHYINRILRLEKSRIIVKIFYILLLFLQSKKIMIKKKTSNNNL